ncbi:hypothetical protein ACGFZS_46780 [Streptomyces sp. NPDC048288]|uniref:hypothetical protein n=1 Tax=Streptomyces sp. NPDC048288 TaxID=3365529 RepID=UPI0037167742
MTVNHSTDAMRYAYGPLLGREPLEHEHILAKDPMWLGWRCQLLGCGFFKPAAEFDGVAVLTGEGAGGGS